jgi:acyl carrier protein
MRPRTTPLPLRGLAILLLATTAGCVPKPEDVAVRTAIAEVLEVQAENVPFDVPLGDPPLNADELDVVEITMVIEEKLKIKLPDAEIERAAGTAKVAELPRKLTARMLARAVRRVRQKEKE